MSLSSSNTFSSMYATNFEIYVAKADFKFNAAHFVAFRGFRERLHGHNYTVGLRLLGSRHISSDGYVLDFGDVKKVVKLVCKELNERFLCPTQSDVIDMQVVDSEANTKSVVLTCEDGARFEMPYDDCAMLPIVHATVEELAIYVWGQVLNRVDPQLFRQRGIHTMETVLAEAPGQEAVFRYEIPDLKPGEKFEIDIPSFIRSGEVEITPKPCLDQQETAVATETSQNTNTAHRVPMIITSDSGAVSGNKESGCCDSCSLSKLSKQLEALASALNEKRPLDREFTADDLRSMMEKS
mmetsp:Transcript_12160/g.34801  ORF Transcript_12160/g.34801 Transcript_12160/m.34801 type:complete len:296 (-) Transcript_12160:363-1250(-)